MNNKLYNLLFGFFLLVGLYFSLDKLVYFLIILVFAEGITGLVLAYYLADFPVPFLNDAPPREFRTSRPGFLIISAPRIWRLLVGVILTISYVYFYNELWFIPWFMGFSIFGAGVSSVCPMLAAIRMTGLK